MDAASSDPVYLRTQQYATGVNLSARIELHRRFTTSPVPWHKWLFERMSIPHAGRILELGCGTGLFWRALEDRVSPEWDLLLTDFSEGMVREALRVTSPLPCRVRAAVVDAEAIPIADDSEDVLVAKHMLYHVPDRDRAVQEIRRILGPGGVLYATTIGRTYMHQLVDLAARCVPGAPSFRDRVLEQFGEETGLEQLRRWFPNVDAEVFHDELRVTDAEAVAAYVRSTSTWSGLSAEDLDRITDEVQREIDREGAFLVDSQSVLFSCRD
jgi:ubiquinone/menaquinone biosynthesis C-methylase UbiE